MDLSKSKILITGASGHLGKQLVYDLVKLDIKPICHVRETSDTKLIDSFNLEKRTADLRNLKQIEKLVEGIDYIIYTAAIVDFRQDRLAQFVSINTVGAVDLFKASSRAGVQKFLHVSTVAAVGALPYRKKVNNHLSENDYPTTDENTQFNLENLRIPYIMSKHAAEKELLKEAEHNHTRLIIVNPSIILAPSRSGDNRDAALKRFFKSFIMPDFGNIMNLVDIRDVSHGIVLALEKGKSNERYILSGDNLTGRDLALTASAILGKVPHLIKMPKKILNLVATSPILAKRFSGISKVKLYPDLIKLLDYDWVYSSNKARQELGYNYRSIYVSLNEILNNGFTDYWDD